MTDLANVLVLLLKAREEPLTDESRASMLEQSTELLVEVRQALYDALAVGRGLIDDIDKQLGKRKLRLCLQCRQLHSSYLPGCPACR